MNSHFVGLYQFSSDLVEVNLQQLDEGCVRFTLRVLDIKLLQVSANSPCYKLQDLQLLRGCLILL